MTEPTKPNENEEQRSAPEQTPPMQPIVDMGAVTTRTARGTVYCLTVVGQIEGHSLLPNTVKTTKYEHVLPLLAALDESEEIDGVLLLLSMYDRSYDLYVRDGGIAQYAVSDYGRHKMTDVFLDNFGEDDWRGGFEDYLFACDEYLTLAEQGTPREEK